MRVCVVLRGCQGLFLCLLVAGCTRDAGSGDAERPKHVILISLDTARADKLAPWGGEQALSPSLAALALESVVFLDASSPAPTTLAAHTSMMTGRPPRAHGTPRNGFMVHPDNVTLAELCGHAGLQTLAVIGSFALESLFGLDQGFARYDEDFGLEYKPGLYDQNQRRASDVTTRALQLLDEELAQDSAAGLFLFAHYFDPHAPYDPPDWALSEVGLAPGTRADLKEIAKAVSDQQHAAAGVRLGQRWVFSNGLRAELLDGASGEPSERGELLAQLYDAEVRALDRELGRLIDGLMERGVLDDAMLIVTGDHGETFWEHGDFWNHGLGLYQTTLHVPLLVRLPDGARGGHLVQEPVSTLDLVPTICQALGVPSPPGLVGVDLSPAWAGQALGARVLFSEATQPVGEVEKEQLWPNAAKAKSARQGRWKYILTPYLGNREELYDLSVDPGESRNLLLNPDVEALEKAAGLRADLEHWVGLHSPLPSRFNSAQTDAVLQRLEALGYAGEDD